MREVVFENLETFISGMREMGIGAISFSATLEMRPVQISDTALQVENVNRVELIAYRDSVIYKCLLRDIEHGPLYEKLVSEGFAVTRRSRNIT